MSDRESTETDMLLDEELADYQIDAFILQSKMFCDKLELFNNCPKKVIVDLLDAFGITDVHEADRFHNDTRTRLKSILEYLINKKLIITVKDLMDKLDKLNQSVIRLRLKESQNIILNEINEIKRKKDQKDINNNKNIILFELSLEQLYTNHKKDKCVFLLYVSENQTQEFIKIKQMIKEKLDKFNIRTKELNEDSNGEEAYKNSLNEPILVIMDKKLDHYFDVNENKDQDNKYTKFGKQMYKEYLNNKCKNRRFYRFNFGTTSSKYPFLNKVQPTTDADKESSLYDLDELGKNGKLNATLDDLFKKL